MVWTYQADRSVAGGSSPVFEENAIAGRLHIARTVLEKDSPSSVPNLIVDGRAASRQMTSSSGVATSAI